MKAYDFVGDVDGGWWERGEEDLAQVWVEGEDEEDDDEEEEAVEDRREVE